MMPFCAETDAQFYELLDGYALVQDVSRHPDDGEQQLAGTGVRLLIVENVLEFFSCYYYLYLNYFH